MCSLSFNSWIELDSSHEKWHEDGKMGISSVSMTTTKLDSFQPKLSTVFEELK